MSCVVLQTHILYKIMEREVFVNFRIIHQSFGPNLELLKLSIHLLVCWARNLLSPLCRGRAGYFSSQPLHHHLVRTILSFRLKIYQTTKTNRISKIIYIVSLLISCHGDVRGSTKSWVSSICFENPKKYLNLFPFTLNMCPFFVFSISIAPCGYMIFMINGPIHLDYNFLGNK